MIFYILEIQLLSNAPYRVSVSNSYKTEANNGKDYYPPIITHTAATPQGSPNATLEFNKFVSPNSLYLNIETASTSSGSSGTIKVSFQRQFLTSINFLCNYSKKRIVQIMKIL